jgi:bifunctional non-homologous end joining protein LigD
MKTRMQQEDVIGGITEPSGGRHYFGVGALMLGVYDKGRLQYVGHMGTGFPEALEWIESTAPLLRTAWHHHSAK